jgi:hypothetical protein
VASTRPTFGQNVQISELHEQLKNLTTDLLEAQKARHLTEAKLLCMMPALLRAEQLADSLAETSGMSKVRAVQLLRAQRDQVIQTASRLRIRLAATQCAATQHAQLSAQHAARAEVRLRD